MKAIINIKTDKEVKEEAQKATQELGLPLSTVINAYLKQFIRSREVYLSSAPRINPMLEKLIGQAEKDFKIGKNISGPFSSAEEMDVYLDTL